MPDLDLEDAYAATARHHRFLDVVLRDMQEFDVQHVAVLLADRFKLPIGPAGRIVAAWRRQKETTQ